MIKSEITLREAIEYIKGFSPVKIIFNNIVLYNDFDSDVEIDVLEDGTKVYGENKRPLDVVPDRLWQFDKYVVTFVDIKVEMYHHSIVTMKGYYDENAGNDVE